MAKKTSTFGGMAEKPKPPAAKPKGDDPLLAEKTAVDERAAELADEVAVNPNDNLLASHYRAVCDYSGALAGRIAANKNNPGA